MWTKTILSFVVLICSMCIEICAEKTFGTTAASAFLNETYTQSLNITESQNKSPGCLVSFLKKRGNVASRITIPLITFTASTVGNSVAIFVIWRNQNRSKKQSVFYTLVMTLALLDLTSTVVTSPITFLAYDKLECVMDLGGQALCDYSGFTMTFFGIASMALVFFMAIERLIAVRFAFFYQTKITPARTRAAIMLIMAFFLLLSALPLIGFGRIEQQVPGTWCFLDWKCTDPLHQAYNLMIVALGIVMMFGTIFCNAFVIIQVIRKRRKMRLANSTLQILSKRKLRKMAYDELQMIVLLGVMTCVFVVCYLPLLLRILINQIEARTAVGSVESLSSWDLFAVWMAALNPVLDPWVYILCRRSTITRFFRLVKLTVTCKCSKEECQNAFSVGRDYKRRASMRNSQRSFSSQSASKRALIARSGPSVDPTGAALKCGKLWRQKTTQRSFEQGKEPVTIKPMILTSNESNHEER